jgi:hypothetical protein
VQVFIRLTSSVDVVLSEDIEHRLYLAHGTLTMNSGKQIACDLVLSYDIKDNLEISCSFYLKDSDVISVIEQLTNRGVQYCSFLGSLPHGGTISIDKMGLDSGTMKSIPKEDGAILKHELKFDNIAIILRYMGILGSIPNFLSNNFLVIFRFITVSPVNIMHKQKQLNETLTLKWGLSNFEFGHRRSDSTFLVNKQSFQISLLSNKIRFEKVENYDFIIYNLVKGEGSAVTCHAIVDETDMNPFELVPILSNICFLLSLATSNWVTLVYCDLFRGNDIVQTIIFNTKRRPFIKSQYLINIENIDDLKNFLEITFSSYSQIVNDFPLNKIIDYIISSLAGPSLQASFIIAYVALENLCSRIEDFAEKRGERLRPQSIEDMKRLLRQLFVRYNKWFTEAELEVIATKVAYKEISIKQAQKYILDAFGVSFDPKTIAELHQIRNSLFHGGDYEHTLLRGKTNQLYDLISKTLLKMLKWNGAYISKAQGHLAVEMD